MDDKVLIILVSVSSGCFSYNPNVKFALLLMTKLLCDVLYRCLLWANPGRQLSTIQPLSLPPDVSWE